MREFFIYGPYDVAETKYRKRNGKPGRPPNAWKYKIDPNNAPEYNELKDRYGCYVFGVMYYGFTPWYVGKTERTFEKEIFTLHKIYKLQELRKLQKNGKLQAVLIAPVQTKGAKNAKATDQIEEFLIGSCYRVNPSLLNRRRLPKSAWEISGVTNTKKGPKSKGVGILRDIVRGDT